jgi:adenylosuccinate lyase
MISRYSRPEMTEIFSEAAQLEAWLLIEQALVEVQTAQKVIPSSAGKILVKKLRDLREKKKYSVARFRALEVRTRHEFLAFLEMVAEKLGPESAYLHLGVTSSDVLDTATMLQLQAAMLQLLSHFDQILPLLKARADETRDLVTVGRTHGMFAEPTSFGLKFLGWYSEGLRNQDRLLFALTEVSFGKISGAVGNNSFVSVEQETETLKLLGLNREPVSTQVIPRDRIVAALSVVAMVGVWIERVCTEIRHLQRSEVGEVNEGFEANQKGSSAMPHKKNPIACENLVGCARLLRSHVQASFENCALWHERDMSHSSVERVILPDSFILLDYMLARFTSVVSKLKIDESRVLENRTRAGEVSLSGKLLTQLGLAGCPRTLAYEFVQKVAFRSNFDGIPLDQAYALIISEDSKRFGKLKRLKINWKSLLNDQVHLREVKQIYAKIE